MPSLVTEELAPGRQMLLALPVLGGGFCPPLSQWEPVRGCSLEGHLLLSPSEPHKEPPMNSEVAEGRDVEQPGPPVAAQGKRHLLIVNPPPTNPDGLPLLPDFPWPSCTAPVYEPTARFALKRVYSEMPKRASLESGNRHSWKGGFARSRVFSPSLYEEAGGASTALKQRRSTREERTPPKCQRSGALGGL